MATIKVFKAEGTCMYPIIKENTILCVNKQDISKVKEGTIVVVDIEEKYIGHILLGIGSNNAHSFVITSSLKSPRLDKLNPVEKFMGIVLKSYDTELQMRHIKVMISPFILILIRNLMSFSYFMCGLVYSIVKLNMCKVRNITNTILEESKKWGLVWSYFALRRL